MAKIDVKLDLVAHWLASIGSIILLCLAGVGLFICFACDGKTNIGNNGCGTCIVSCFWTIACAIYITLLEWGKSPVGQALFSNTLYRGILYIIILVFSFWGWFAFFGSLMIYMAAIFYLLAFATGIKSTFSDGTMCNRAS